MRKIELQKVDHEFKAGQASRDIEPNVTSDSLLTIDGEVVGVYLRSSPYKMKTFFDIADAELRSDRVPKTEMSRVARDEKGNWRRYGQYSAIVGSVPPKPHMRRSYPTISSVHSHPKAVDHIKSMLLGAAEAEKLINKYMPTQYQKQKELLEQVPEQWRFGKLFTSGISNCNIAAAYHQDNANIKGTVNVIVTKRKNAEGGNLHVPDYGLVFDQCSDSVLIYPAWANLHGVTPIKVTKNGGYRNSLILYPLKAFVDVPRETITTAQRAHAEQG